MMQESESADLGRSVIKVICVDDHAFLIEGIRARLALEQDLEIVATLGSADDLVSVAGREAPCVVLLDIELPGRDPFEAIGDLARVCPDARVILLSAFVRDSYLDSGVSAGAWGYLSKRDEPKKLIDAIRRVSRGEFVFGDEIVERCGCEPGAGGRPAPGLKTSRLGLLTPRERQILSMIGRGLSRADIAAAIHRSPKTVDAHRASIMEKLGLHDRVELARFAIREGLAEL